MSDTDEIEIAQTLAKIPEFNYLKTLDMAGIRHEITHKITKILREYYWENTRGHKSNWSKKFAEAGITEDEGKAAIACIRRLGSDIS
jgi:hypothetical protein